MGDYVAFNAIVGALYCLLAVAVAARMIVKCIRRGSTAVKRNRVSAGVNILVIVYCATRSVSLFIIAAGATPNHGHLKDHMGTFIPATFFILLQTGLIAKWVHHVSALTVAVLSERFRMGYVALTMSAITGVCMVVMNTTAFIRLQVSAISSSEETRWNVAVCIATGFAYAFNGLCFITLGIRLRQLWTPSSEAGISMARKILLVAGVFGFLCVSRGVALTFYAFNSMDHVDHTGWAAPATLLYEWTGLAITVFLLSSASSEAGQQDDSLSIQRSQEPLVSRTSLRSSLLRRMDYSTAPADQSAV